MKTQELHPYRDEISVPTARDFSPGSLIFTADSVFSLFSDASASVDQCSFASDLLDLDSPASDFSPHLAGNEFHDASAASNICCPHIDIDPNNVAGQYRNSCITNAKAKDIEQKEAGTADGSVLLDSARSSVSIALEECQVRRSRSEATLRKTNRRPASVDLNSSMINPANFSSPRFRGLKKTPLVNSRNGTFPSPGTPINRHSNVGIQKGWMSERVPLHNGSHRRHLNAALLPYNSGKALPSKWEDAERWIVSPISGDGALRRSVQQPQRRPKSKSGPLGPPGTVYNSMYSPAVLMLEGSSVASQIANSPFSAGVLGADGLSIRRGGFITRENFPAPVEPSIARSVSIHGCSELITQSSLSDSLDENLDGFICSNAVMSHAVSRRDVATQMSPENSPRSSTSKKASFVSSSPSAPPIVELRSVYSPKPEMRDVQVDEPVTMTRRSRKHRGRVPLRGLRNADDWKKKAVEVHSSSWDLSETAKTLSKMKREEAKINAWENLQKAKAEAEMRKLEMKLEKKRSSSMDRIMNKLKSAQKKAQSMRSSITDNQNHQIAGSSFQRALSFQKTRKIGSLSGCFTCHAF